ncbi:MAG: hypothetical protein QT09_C0005G0071 [archaeon GW2011_AR18]|nr:MAG: hypothetical protein QT09_C0005G0071 [archaeon GW2011_AR18]
MDDLFDLLYSPYFWFTCLIIFIICLYFILTSDIESLRFKLSIIGAIIFFIIGIISYRHDL